jgi:D-galactose 1-dehydrogenase
VSPIAIGIAGFGKIARDQHGPAIAGSDAFKLAAIADPAARNSDIPFFASLTDMLAARPDIAAIALCMPPRQRAAAAREAIEAGRHVLLEKPPAVTLGEAEALRDLAAQHGVTLFTAWHSQFGSAVAPARAWLSGKQIRAVAVTWKEDVRVWHPGQAWIWQDGGFGVFDPGINALSILTTILPGPLSVTSAELSVPSNCATPIAVSLAFAGEGFPVMAEFDFLQTGPQSWDIAIEADCGTMVLHNGGNRLEIDGVDQPVAEEAEYPAIYACFAELLRSGASDVDLAPLALVEQAMSVGRVRPAAPFED